MTLFKTLPILSLAFTLIGGTVMLAPTSAKAAGHISFDALKKNNIPQGNKNKNNTRPGAQANKWNRGCNAINRCRG